MTLSVGAVRPTTAFKQDVARVKPDIEAAARGALKKLIANPQSAALRLHALSGYGKPTIYKIDVFANRSWQITFELDGNVAVLLRLGTHHQINRAPR